MSKEAAKAVLFCTESVIDSRGGGKGAGPYMIMIKVSSKAK